MLSVTRNWISDFCRREDGPTAVEYAVLLALIVAVCIAGIAVIGTTSSGVFTAAEPAPAPEGKWVWDPD